MQTGAGEHLRISPLNIDVYFSLSARRCSVIHAAHKCQAKLSSVLHCTVSILLLDLFLELTFYLLIIQLNCRMDTTVLTLEGHNFIA